MATVAHLGGAGDTSNTTTYVSASMTPTAGDLLVIFTSAVASVDTTATLTESAGGGTYSQQQNSLYAAGANTMFCFVANQLVGASPPARTFTFTLASDAGTAANILVERITGMSRSGSSALKQAIAVGTGATGTTPAATFGSAVTTTNPTVVAAVNAGNPANLTPPASWTELADVGSGTPTHGMETAGRDSGFTGTTVTWGGTSGSGWCAMAVELDASAVATASPPGPRVVLQAVKRSYLW